MQSFKMEKYPDIEVQVHSIHHKTESEDFRQVCLDDAARIDGRDTPESQVKGLVEDWDLPHNQENPRNWSACKQHPQPDYTQN